MGVDKKLYKSPVVLVFLRKTSILIYLIHCIVYIF